jgi:hypothetical protein
MRQKCFFSRSLESSSETRSNRHGDIITEICRSAVAHLAAFKPGSALAWVFMPPKRGQLFQNRVTQGHIVLMSCPFWSWRPVGVRGRRKRPCGTFLASALSSAKTCALLLKARQSIFVPDPVLERKRESD